MIENQGSLVGYMRQSANAENESAGSLDPSRLYFVDESGSVINDVQLDEHAKAYAGQHQGLSFADALSAVSQGLRRVPR